MTRLTPVSVVFMSHFERALVVRPRHEFRPGDRAPHSGDYFELNVFGTRTGRTIMIRRGEPLPTSLTGFTWIGPASRVKSVRFRG
jgi:hypothetical protein